MRSNQILANRTISILFASIFTLALVACKGAEFSSNDKQKNKNRQSGDGLSEGQNNPGGNDSGDNVVIDTRGNIVDMKDKTIDSDGNIIDGQGKILGQVDSINGKDWDGSTEGLGGGAGGLGGGTNEFGLLVEKKLTQKNSHQKRTDVFWTIDTSGSMENEITQVKKNIRPMIDRLEKETDTRIGLMTFVAGADMPQSIFPPLGVLSGVSFKISDSLRSDLFHVEDRLVMSRDSLSLYTNFLNGNGPNFYRNDSAKFLIVVTDDDSDMGDDSFLNEVSKKINLADFKVFGFVGKGTSDCNIANRGKVYANLAKRTGGKIFDICHNDWSKHFQDLTAEIITTVSSGFVVSRQIKSIAKITIDGNTLNQNDYSFEGNIISINESSIRDAGLTVEIHYVPQT